jgi:hypothetical protein
VVERLDKFDKNTIACRFRDFLVEESVFVSDRRIFARFRLLQGKIFCISFKFLVVARRAASRVISAGFEVARKVGVG